MKIENIINHCKKRILDKQKKDGHWVYELEADTTIPSEYILMNHFLGIKEENLEKKYPDLQFLFQFQQLALQKLTEIETCLLD